MSQRSDGRPLAAASVLVHDEDCLRRLVCHTCRAQRGLEKMAEDWAEEGRNSGASLQAHAWEATALIGNLVTPERLERDDVVNVKIGRRLFGATVPRPS